MSEPAPLEVVELRVHGVHGTSPGGMLGVPDDDVDQVAGDTLTGIYRPKPGVTLPGRNLAGLPISVESYSWGALTSGVSGLLGWVKRALWLVLLPFALANLSYWARLGLGDDSAQARWGARATRLGSLLLTVFFILTPCLLGIDVVAWQCYRWGSPTCALPGAFDFIGGLDVGQRLAVGCLIPLGAILVLGLLSSTTLQRYEAAAGPLSGAKDGVLGHQHMWDGALRGRQLQRIHLTVALAVVIAFSGGHVISVDPGTPTWVWVTVLLSTGVAGVAVAWALAIHPHDVDHCPTHTPPIVEWRRRLPAGLKQFLRFRLPDWLLGAAAALTLGHLAALSWLGHPLIEKGEFAGQNLWFITVFVLLTAVHLSTFTAGRMSGLGTTITVASVLVLAGVALAVHSKPSWRAHRTPLVVLGVVVLIGWVWLAYWHRSQGRRFPTVAWNGAGASLLLAAAAWVGLLFTTGTVMASAYYLNGSGHGVGDIVSETNRQTVAAATATDQSIRYDATGQAVLDHAVVRVTPKEVDVLTGSVHVDSLARHPSKPGGTVATVGNARLTSGRLNPESRVLELKDSCIRQSAGACTAEKPDFLAAGTIDLAGRPLVIGADHHAVSVVVAKPPHVPLVVPQVLVWSPLAQVIWLLLVVGFVLLAVRRFRRCETDIERQLDEDGVIPLQDRQACLQARKTAALAHRAEKLIDGVGSITAAIAIALIALSATGQAPWSIWPGARKFATLAMLVAAGLGLGLIYVASLMRRSENARRGLGILWDLTTFWPRAAHPLAPPCYAERVVPELHTRINWVLYDPVSHLPREGTNVVFSAHSQGSAIATAVVSRLSDAELGRLRVITYGSQIRGLYGRIFPKVFGPDELGYQPTLGPTLLGNAFPDAGSMSPPAQPYVPSGSERLMDRLFAAGGDWVNLFRRTDPLGYRVFSDTNEAPDRWVPEVPPVGVGDPGPVVLGHGGYQHSLTYRTTVARWTGEQVKPDPTGVLEVPPLPPG